MTDEELIARYNSTKKTSSKKAKTTDEDLINRYNQTKPQATQPAQSTVSQPKVTTPATTTTTQPTVRSHAGVAQQAHANTGARQAAVNAQVNQTPTEKEQFAAVLQDYAKANNKLPDAKEMEALAKANGLYSGENKYNIDKLQATGTSNPALTNDIRTSQLGNKTINRGEAFDKAYGKQEAEQEIKSYDFNNNINSNKYIEYKEGLAQAKANNDTRNISKYTILLDEFKERFKDNYDGTKLETKQLPGLERTIAQEQQDLNDLANQYLNATDPAQKQSIALQYTRTEENLKNHTKAYNDALAYDEIINKNIAADSAGSFGKNVLGGTANILNSGYALGTKVAGQDATTINANALYNYMQPRNGLANTLQNITGVMNRLNPITGTLNTMTGNGESPDLAYAHLLRLHLTNPNNQRLTKLYNDITNKTYSGTAEDLKNELDAIQKELYQYAKDNVLRTQDELDAVANQIRHNEAAYGNLAFVPNAFGTVGNMVPSMVAGAGAGEVGSMAMLGLNAGGSSMDQALQSGARYNQALNYGIASGATEVATEKMFDTGANKLLGIKGGLDTKGLAKKVIDGLEIKSKVGKVIANTAFDVGGEMVEEMVAEAVNPLWKALSYEGLEALPQNGEELGQYIKDIINAGVEAIPSTLLMQGGGAVLNTYKTQQLENGLIKSINESDLSQIVKNQLINEVRKASTDVKLGLEESDYIQDKAYEKGFNLAAQSEQMKQRIPQGYTLPQSTLDILSFVENNRPGLTITFDANAQGNGTFIENPDGTRTITLNPNATRTNFTKTDTTMLPSNEELIQNVIKSVENEPIVAESLQNNAKNKTNLEDIVDLKPEDAKLNEMRYKQLKDKNTPNQRKFFDNLETSQLLDEETKNRINATAYEQRHNMDVLQAMSDKLDERGNKLVEEWKMKQKNFTDKDIALGAILIERYQQDGDWDSAARAAEKLADMSTESGRALQMYSIFQRLSPETMQIFAQKQLNEAFEEMKKRQTGKWVEKNKDKFKLTGEEAQFIYEQVEKASQAIDEETKQRELSKVEKMINQKLPPEKGQTIRALRRIAMLFNPKTQVRNIVGNTLIMPVNDAADVIGTAIDKILAKKTGVRTTSLPNFGTKAKGGVKGLLDAVKDHTTGTRTEASGNRFEFEVGAKAFNENTDSPLRNKIAQKLNSANELLSAIMSGGDRPFYEAAYQNSLKGQMKANKVTKATPEMEEIARTEAMQRTWNDDNEYTKTVLGIRQAMNKINVNGFGLGDLVIPFAKTPANLTKAMVEYSPAGFIESVIDYNDMRKAISRGEMTPMQQKKFVTSMSKAITGTMLYLIAGTLVKAGKLTGSADDDKDVKNFEQNVMGIQPYSVRIGDKTYTYSWANPINAPLAVMADTYKMNKENASTAEILNNAFKVAGSVLVENSFLSGVKDLFNDGNISEGLVNAVTSMPSSFIPTFISQLASLGDPKQRQTFEYNDTAQTEINKIKNKLPGARNTLEPQVNTFGEEIENQNNVFNAFLNPANVREARVTESQKALYDVYQETKDKTIFPMQAPYYVSKDGEKQNLSSKDRVAYQKASGQYVSKIYDDLFSQDNAFNDNFHVKNDGKVTILKQIATDGNTKGKEAVGVTTSTTDDLNEKITALEEAEIPLADYYIMWYNQKSQKGKQAKRNAINETIRNLDHDISKEQKEVLYGIFNVD